MSNCISKIHIKSYRGIQDLYLDNLKKINILTGDNNSGKTSVLEVISSFSSPADFRKWRTLLRIENPNPYKRGTTIYEGFYDLFNIDFDSKNIEYTIEANKTEFHTVMSAFEVEEEMTMKEYYHIIGFSTNKKDEQSFETVIVPKLELQIDINEEVVNSASIYDGQYRLPVPLNKSLKKYEAKIIYISPTRHAEGELFLSQVLDRPDLYEEMINVLRDYDEDIMSINYDFHEHRNMGRGVYKILSKSHQKALPLNVYGDGMKKAVLLMSAVIAAQDGILLLDEFETAIHTSAMDKTFAWILKTCLKLNVQLFLTSHSEEAINKVLKCVPSLQNDIAVYTLYKDEQGNSVRRLSGNKAIEVQDEMGLELR